MNDPVGPATLIVAAGLEFCVKPDSEADSD
jgi:hypothetical protein